ncbi:MAG: hypothetical protein VW518_00615 [Burkholderiaceae bacterium]
MSKKIIDDLARQALSILDAETFRKTKDTETISIVFYKYEFRRAILKELKFISKENVKKFPHWHLLTKKEKLNIFKDNGEGSITYEANQIWEFLTKNAKRVKREIDQGTTIGIITINNDRIDLTVEWTGQAYSNFEKIRSLYARTSRRAFRQIEERVLKTLNANVQKVAGRKKEVADATEIIDNPKMAHEKDDKPGQIDTAQRQYAISSGALALDHKTSIAYMRREAMASALLDAATEMQNRGSYNGMKFLLTLLNSVEIVKECDGKGNVTQTVRVISSRVNTSTGQKEKNYTVDFKKIEEFLAKRPSLALDLGSDAPVTVVELNVLNRFNSKVKTNKITTKKSTARKPVVTKKAVAKKKSKKQVKLKNTLISTATPKPNFSSQLPRATRRKQPAQNSTFSLLTLINRALPETVAKNMNLPRLKLRTGRFASSVKATDVTTTPQGFLSIGYTYMKAPYQTFEPGYKQGSVERDPRKLIDFSIREIATGLITDRFYTRRL